MQSYITRLEKELIAERTKRRTTLDTRLFTHPTEPVAPPQASRKQLNCTFKENSNRHNFRF